MITLAGDLVYGAAAVSLILRYLRGDERIRRQMMKITDNGVLQKAWTDGVGLSSMRRRAAALGVSIAAGPAESGGEVRVTLPLTVP